MGRQPKLNNSKRFGFNSTIGGHRYYFGRDKKTAERKFTETLHKHHKGEIVSDDSVCHLIDEYLFYKKQTVSEKSYIWYERPLDVFKKHIGPKRKASTLTISDLKLFLVNCWSKRLDGKKLSVSTVQQATRTIKSCFGWLYDNRKIGFHPFKKIKVGGPQTAKNIPSTEQIEKLLKHFESDTDLIDLLNFEIATGCRVQEARVILCSQVDIKNKKITLTEEQTKSYASLKDKRLRTIILNDEAISIVKRNLDKHKTGLLFQNPQSVNSENAWTTQAIRMRFNRAKKTLGFYFPQRMIRHYWATMFLKNNGNIAAGAALLGHSTPKMLLENYQKIYQKSDFLVEQANIVKPIKTEGKNNK